MCRSFSQKFVEKSRPRVSWHFYWQVSTVLFTFSFIIFPFFLPSLLLFSRLFIVKTAQLGVHHGETLQRVSDPVKAIKPLDQEKKNA